MISAITKDIRQLFEAPGTQCRQVWYNIVRCFNSDDLIAEMFVIIDELNERLKRLEYAQLGGATKGEDDE